MATTVNGLPDIFTRGGTVAVDVAQIERQLHALWQEGGEAVGRACLFNLVVWCESETDVEHAGAIVGELTVRHPCRAIVLLAEPLAAESNLSASLSAHCRLASDGRRQVCCEQITVRASGSAVAQLSPTVLSLLEGDLPTVLWWRGNLLEPPESFERLRTAADRIVFDSSCWPEAEQRLERLRELLRLQPARRHADLSWTRLALWRKLTADCFDEPAFRTLLGRIQCVWVQHGSGPGARLRALLYAGWLAARLGWMADCARSCVRITECSGRDVAAIGIQSVELLAGDASALIQKDFDQHTAQATVTVPLQQRSVRRQAFTTLSEAALMSQTLEQSGTAASYEAAVELAVALG